MGLLSRIGADTATLAGAKVTVGRSSAVMDELVQVAGSARSTISAELFGLSDEASNAALSEAARRGVRVTLHADDEALEIGRYPGVAENANLVLSSHGAMPVKLHTKALVADGTHAFLGTAAPVWELRARPALDVAATFDGEAAAALQRLTDAAASGNTERIRATANEAARHGIFVNDPAHGVTLLRKRINTMVDGATESIYVGTKVLDDEKLLARLASAAQRGVQVLVETSPAGKPKWVDRARTMGIDTSFLTEFSWRIHSNTVVVDRSEAYIGTAMVTRRGMARATAGRPAREMGFVTRDSEAVRQVLDAYATLPDSRLPALLARLGTGGGA